MNTMSNENKQLRADESARSTNANLVTALLIAGTALALSITALTAKAEITQDCILEGTVDMRTAEKLGQPVYVKFRNARSGPDANCSMNRRSKSRRVQFVSSPDVSRVEDAAHGDQVRYRYLERDGRGTWQLVDVNEG